MGMGLKEDNMKINIKKWWWSQRLSFVMSISKLLRINVRPPHLGKIPSYVIRG